MYIIFLPVFFAAILAPFITIMFFIRTESLLLTFPILFFSLLLLIISTLVLRAEDQKQSRKKVYPRVAISAIVLFFLSYGFQIKVADWLFFKARESKLTLLIQEIKKYNKIHEMSDGQRFWKSVNHIIIEPNIADIDTSIEFGEKYFLDDVLIQQGIDKHKYENFRNILIDTNLISFTTLEDGTISFTIDGFIDNCYGIAYSETGIRPYENDCGQILYWSKITDRWYAWGTT